MTDFIDFIDFKEEDRIEHIHGYSHCRCRNKLNDGNYSCTAFKKVVAVKYRKVGLPENQLCIHSSDQGYCRLSRLDELALIKKTSPENLHLIVNRISTEKGVRHLRSKLGEKKYDSMV